MIRLILWLSVFWIVPLMTYMLINETKFHKNIVLGVTLPQEARNDEEIKGVLAKFRRDSIIVCAGLLVLAAVFCFLSSDQKPMTLWGIWLTLAIVVPYIPYVITNAKLKKVKEEKGWKKTPSVIMVDTAAIPSPKWMSPVWFVPPFLISLLPVLWDKEMWFLYAIFALMILLFWFSYRYLYRNKAEIVDANTELTKALSQVRKYNWGSMWIVSAYFMALTAFFPVLAGKNVWLAAVIMGVFTVGLCVYAFHVEMRTRRIQEKLTKDSGKDLYVDDDDHWIAGMFYYNPDDAMTIVNNRVGINGNVNFARPFGKIMAVFLVLLIVGMPFMGVFFDHLGEQEITLRTEDDILIGEAGWTKYEIPFDTVTEVTLLDKLPERLIRKAGSSFENLIKGRFYSEETGNIRVLLDPGVPPYIYVKTTGWDYILNVRDKNLTTEIYNKLKTNP
ncbi:MAG: hypothetical protein II186_06225 [Erysipelotrichales bacterium]|nr:hypothetical protein [Erysipelotrichales bacterium]